MEATAHKVELDLIVQAVALPDGLGVHYADVVVRHGNSKSLFVAVKSHAQDLVLFGRRRLPLSDKVVCMLA